MKSVLLIPFILLQFFYWPWSQFEQFQFSAVSPSFSAISVNKTLNNALSGKDLQVRSIQQELAQKLLRLHVRAASDRPEDQELKYLVKDKTVELLEQLLDFCSSKEEAMAKIKENIPVLQYELQEFLDSADSPQHVSLSLEPSYFPVKLYGDLIFPAGIYDALLVVLEEGKGQNWWCVLYPPLCFTDLCTQSVPEESKQQLETMLTADAWEGIQIDAPSARQEKNTPRIRFWIADFFKSLFR